MATERDTRTLVVTYQAPGSARRLSLCGACEKALAARGVEAHSRHGMCYCDVYFGRHYGECSRCVYAAEGDLDGFDDAYNVW